MAFSRKTKDILLDWAFALFFLFVSVMSLVLGILTFLVGEWLYSLVYTGVTLYMYHAAWRAITPPRRISDVIPDRGTNRGAQSGGL